jgi:hypothetical protein
MPIDTLEDRNWIDGHDLLFVNNSQLIYHCHHFNLFFDQTIDDAVGAEAGAKLRFRAGRQSARHMISALKERKGLNTPPEIIDAAQKLFASLGQGKVDLSTSEFGGTSVGEYLHYGYSWKEKYGSKVKRKHPADAFALGYSAAANEIAYGLDLGEIGGRETECIALGDPQCRLKLSRSNEREQTVHFTEDQAQELLGDSMEGLDEERIEQIAAGLKDFTASVDSDERGLIQAFGVFVSRNSANYYNQIAFEAVNELEKIDPSLGETGEELLREAGRQCGFNTYGGILTSPEWESMVGAPTSNPQEIAGSCMAISRALGFGHWTLHEFKEDERIVIRTPATYETGYYRANYGMSEHSRSYILHGAAIAVAHLAHGIDWDDDPTISSERYNELIAGNTDWQWEAPNCHSCGDDFTEIILTKG